MMKHAGQITRRYATALFELAVENNAVPEIASQAKAIVGAVDESIASMMVNPGYPEEAKSEVMKTLIQAVGAHPVFKGFLELILANRRFVFLRGILSEFLSRADTHLGISRVDLYTARPVSSGELSEFEASLSDAMKSKVIITPKVDETLKAGYLIKIGNTIVDASLRSRLANLKESLSQGV